MKRPPNVILILSDDHGYGDRSAVSTDPAVHTPALDRLAREGTSCLNGYVTAPICSPSRAGLISGSYQQRWGATWFSSSQFPDELPSIAERFTDLGYRTGYFGKVHYGSERPSDRGCPPHHGFAESYYGLAGQQQGRLNYLHHSTSAVQEYGPEACWRMAVQPMMDGDQETELEGFLTEELGNRAIDFVQRHAQQPFFLMLAFNAVHNFCWQLPAEELDRRGLPTRSDWIESEQSYEDWYDGAISPNLEHGRDYYLAQLELMDAAIGRLLDQLDQSSLSEDTVVVYLTDNGGSTCNYGDNAPLSGTKYTLWEGGIRVPFLLRWPAGGWRGGSKRSPLVSSLDLYPTLLAAAGADPSAYQASDGINQGAMLRGDPAEGHQSLHWDCGFQWAVRAGDLKLRYADGSSETAAGIRQVEHAETGDGLALFDLGHDIGEKRNLAAERPGEVDRLRRLHEKWRHRVGLAS